ncbi:MAG: class I SAM-dependent methyltransferase [Chlorobiaceae bacterium]
MSFYSDFAPYYEKVFPFREQVYSFLREHAGRLGGAVLDAGCGPGHYCGMFLRDGFRVTGIDLDQMMIDAASAAYPQGIFNCMDIAEIGSLENSFQLAYSIGNVLAHLPFERLGTFIEDSYAILQTRGYWIVQLVNWDYLLTQKDYTFPVKTIFDGSVTFHRRYSRISPEGVVFEAKLIIEGATVFNEQTKLYPLASDLFFRLHQAAGFLLEGVYADFDKSKFRKECQSGLIMVFRKR